MNNLLKTLAIMTVAAVYGTDISADTDWPLQFDALEYDFGNINEEDGVVSHTFMFSNISSETVIIDNVSTSCGCTTASYPTVPIPSGQICEFTVNFNPARTDGRVYRDIEIFVKGRKDCMGLVLMATVTPAPLGVKQMYPHPVAGNVRTAFNNSAFGYIAQGHSVTKGIGIVNDSETPVKLSATVSGNSGILSVECPPLLEAGQTDHINLTYSMPETEKYGTMIDTVWIWADGKKGTVPVTVTAIGTDNFGDGTGPQPKLATDPSYIDLGTQKTGKVLKQKFIIRNDGNADLIIRAVELSEGTTADLASKTVITPGSSVTMNVATVVKGQKGRTYSSSVNLITNDPVRPRRELRMTVSAK